MAVPGVPRDLRLGTVTHNSYRAIWTAPPSGGKTITQYDARFSGNAGSSWNNVSRVGSGSGRSYTRKLSGKVGGRDYWFSIRARNADGIGKWSGWRKVTLKADTPGQPTDVIGTLLPVVGPTSPTVSVSWIPPVDTGGKPLTPYDIWYWWNGVRYPSTGGYTLPPDKNVFSFTGPVAGDSLIFYVRSNNVDRQGTHVETEITLGRAGSGGRVWDGSRWTDATSKIWDGSRWVDSIVKVWDGSRWVDAA